MMVASPFGVVSPSGGTAYGYSQGPVLPTYALVYPGRGLRWDLRWLANGPGPPTGANFLRSFS